LELRHLRYFVAVAEHLSFTRAADQLHVTQSTLSHQIRRLEEEIGQPLFERAARRVRITHAGKLLLSTAIQVLEDVDQSLLRIKGEAQEIVEELRIGTTQSLNTNLIPRVTAIFIAAFPHTRVSITEFSHDELIGRISDGSVDIGVTFVLDADAAAVDVEPILTETFVFVAHHEHRLAARTRLRLMELHHVELVLYTPNYAMRRMLDEQFATAGVVPLIRVETMSTASILELVRNSGLATIVPRMVVPRTAQIRAVRLYDPVPVRRLGILWRKGRARSQAERFYAEQVTRSARSLYPPDPKAAD
jgi:LysR family transcriptional regulator, cyn operon transcriptional activator